MPAAWWSRNGEPFAEAMTLGDSPDPEHRSRAVQLLESLGAAGTASRLLRTLGTTGARVAARTVI